MPAYTATAPGKIILFGEHAVVYNRPAIAVPVGQVGAQAVVIPGIQLPEHTVRLEAPDIGLNAILAELPENHPFVVLIQALLAEQHLEAMPACTLRVTSTIPIAAGMGSGAAISVASLLALSAFLGRPLEKSRVSALAYEVEKLYHGTPSGIDNTVISYQQPVYYQRNLPIEIFKVPAPFVLVIADTGTRSPTSVAVGDVHRAWQADPDQYEGIFDQIGVIVQSARQALESGSVEELGPLMDENHRKLVELGVSSPLLDALIEAARSQGALGAKLSGAGRGGNMIALVKEKDAVRISNTLIETGAIKTITTWVGK